jgi:hypothetical protein
MKTRILKYSTFAELFDEMGTQTQSVLFYCDPRCPHVYNFRREEALFLEKDNLVHADHFHNELFVPNLAYIGVSGISFYQFSTFYAKEKYERRGD